jgi:hypothetical protein
VAIKPRRVVSRAVFEISKNSYQKVYFLLLRFLCTSKENEGNKATLLCRSGYAKAQCKKVLTKMKKEKNIIEKTPLITPLQSALEFGRFDQE